MTANQARAMAIAMTHAERRLRAPLISPADARTQDPCLRCERCEHYADPAGIASDGTIQCEPCLELQPELGPQVHVWPEFLWVRGRLRCHGTPDGLLRVSTGLTQPLLTVADAAQLSRVLERWALSVAG